MSTRPSMLRATSTLLLLTGVVLLVTWGVLPAQSQSTRTLPRVPAPAIDFPAELADVNAEVDRLSARLDRQVAFPEPTRDLFNFSSRSRVRVGQAGPPEPVAPVVIELVQPAWPTLVAIMARAGDGALEVALTDASEELHVVTAGGSVGAFVISEISPESVLVIDPASKQSTRLALR